MIYGYFYGYHHIFEHLIFCKAQCAMLLVKNDKNQMKTLRLKCYLMECKQHVLYVKDFNVTVNNKNQHECFLEPYFTLIWKITLNAPIELKSHSCKQ